MFEDTDSETRRSVIKTVGGALGVAALSGAASADAASDDVSTGDCVTADGPDGVAGVFSECGSTDAVGRVTNGETGTVRKVCQTIDGTAWGYVVWDDASPDGWVPEGHLSGCITPN